MTQEVVDIVVTDRVDPAIARNLASISEQARASSASIASLQTQLRLLNANSISGLSNSVNEYKNSVANLTRGQAELGKATGAAAAADEQAAASRARSAASAVQAVAATDTLAKATKAAQSASVANGAATENEARALQAIIRAKEADAEGTRLLIQQLGNRKAAEEILRREEELGIVVQDKLTASRKAAANLPSRSMNNLPQNNVSQNYVDTASERAAMAQAAALQNLQQRADALRTSIDPLTAAQFKLNSVTQEANLLFKAGAITETEQANAISYATKKFDEFIAKQQQAIAAQEALNTSAKSSVVLGPTNNYPKAPSDTMLAEERAATLEAAAMANLQQRAAALQASVDPLWASQQKLNNSIKEASALLKVSAISEETYTLAVAAANAEHAAFTTTVGKTEKALVSNYAKVEGFRVVGDIFTGRIQNMERSLLALISRLNVMHLIFNPITLGGLALVGVFVAIEAELAKMESEFDKFQNSLAATGNYAGATVAQLEDLSAAVSKTNGISLTSGSGIVAGYAASGKYTLDQIQKLSDATQNWADITGQKTKQVQQSFNSIADDPGKFAEDFAKSTNLISASAVEQIKWLQETGRSSEAVALAVKSVADAANSNKAAITGWTELIRFMGAVTDSTNRDIASFIATLFGFHGPASQISDDAKTVADDLKRVSDLQKELANAPGSAMTGGSAMFGGSMSGNTAVIQDRLEAAKKQLALDQQVARQHVTASQATVASDQATAASNKLVIDAQDRLSGEFAKSGDNVALFNAKWREYQQQVAIVARASPTSPFLPNAQEQADEMIKLMKQYEPMAYAQQQLIDGENNRLRDQAAALKLVGDAYAVQQELSSKIQEAEKQHLNISQDQLANWRDQIIAIQQLTRVHSAMSSLYDKLVGPEQLFQAQATAINDLKIGLDQNAFDPMKAVVSPQITATNDNTSAIRENTSAIRSAQSAAASSNSSIFASGAVKGGTGVPLAGVSPADKLALAQMIATEAGNQGTVGMAAVGSVAINRLQAGTYGGSLSAVVNAPYQFEGMQHVNQISPATMQRATVVANALIQGMMGDPTSGALNFINKALQTADGRSIPAWAKGPGLQLGDHTFFGGTSISSSVVPTPPSTSRQTPALADPNYDVAVSSPGIAYRVPPINVNSPTFGASLNGDMQKGIANQLNIQSYREATDATAAYNKELKEQQDLNSILDPQQRAAAKLVYDQNEQQKQLNNTEILNQTALAASYEARQRDNDVTSASDKIYADTNGLIRQSGIDLDAAKRQLDAHNISQEKFNQLKQQSIVEAAQGEFNDKDTVAAAQALALEQASLIINDKGKLALDAYNAAYQQTIILQAQDEANMQALAQLYGTSSNQFRQAWSKAQQDVLQNSDNMWDGMKLGMAEFVQQSGSSAQQVATVMNNAINSFASTFATFVTTGKFSFGEFARSIIADITQMIVKMLLMKAVMSLIPGLSGGGMASSGGGGFTDFIGMGGSAGDPTGLGDSLSGAYASGGIADIPGFADGNQVAKTIFNAVMQISNSNGVAKPAGIGQLVANAVLAKANATSSTVAITPGASIINGSINGPGSGTSDSILAKISDGEFIINANSTKRYLPLLQAINNNRPLPTFADGGSVSNDNVMAGGTSGASRNTYVESAPVFQLNVDARGATDPNQVRAVCQQVLQENTPALLEIARAQANSDTKKFASRVPSNRTR